MSKMTVDELLSKPAGVLIKTTLVDFPGLVASSFFMRGCNLRCPYCYNIDLVETESVKNQNLQNLQNSSNSSKIELISALQVLEHLFHRKGVIGGLVISGGEPLLNPVTPILIKNAKSLDIKIKIDTNGMNPSALEDLIKNPETCPDFIALDIKTSPNRYKNDIPQVGILQNQNPAELLQKSVEIIKNAKIDLKLDFEIRTVLVPHLVEKSDIEEIAKIIPSDSSWQFAQFRNENCLDPNYNKIAPYIDSQLKDLVDFAKTFVPNAKLR